VLSAGVQMTAMQRKHMLKSVIFTAVFLLSASDVRAQLNVYFINVGQGDAIFVEFPNGTNALIDGGPNGASVAQFLKSKGVTKIDRVVLTHPHSDHYRGLKKIFTDFTVKTFYDTKAENRDAVGDNNLRELAASEETGCRLYFPKPDAILQWDPQVTVKVLNTCAEPVIIHDNDENNNCSLVLRLYYNGNGIMLTGDSESGIENSIMSRYKSGLNSSILKVAHHGSRFSSSDAFLARVRPEYALISVGLNNVYGHPHKETLDRLRASGAKIVFTTGGTQSMTIPAPKKGVTAEPIFNNYSVTADQKFEDMTLTWTPEAPAGLDAPAAKQLTESAAK
jgi:competence protein ComEC